MVRGRRSELWDHTSTLWALQANVNRDPARQPEPFEAKDIHPLWQDEPTPEEQEQIGRMLRRLDKIDALARTDPEKAAALIEYTWPSEEQ